MNYIKPRMKLRLWGCLSLLDFFEYVASTSVSKGSVNRLANYTPFLHASINLFKAILTQVLGRKQNRYE